MSSSLHVLAVIAICGGLLSGVFAGIDNSSYRTKGYVAHGELADYERGAVNWETLLADYRSYGLPLPPEGAELIQFPRSIWAIEGPMRVWHLGFALPPEKGKEEQPMRFLVGAEVFVGRAPRFKAMDKVLEDGTIVKAKQPVPADGVEPWDGTDLEMVDFIFHGQEKEAADTNALFATALQLYHLGDARAEHLMGESLRFDADHYMYWVSDYTQPAGWTPREILAEVAWRAIVNQWYFGVRSAGDVEARLRKILPRLPRSRRDGAERLLGQIDPDLGSASAEGSLLGELLKFAMEGEDWEPLFERAKADDDAFETLLPLLADDRVIPFKPYARQDFSLPRGERVKLWWYRRDRYARVCDYAAILLDEVCERSLLGVDGTADRDCLEAVTARARLWQKASRQPNPAAYIRSRWFETGSDGERRVHLAAIELQALMDFDTLASDLPKELDVVSAEGLADLCKVILIGGQTYYQALRFGEKRGNAKERVDRDQADKLLCDLYEASEACDPQARAVFLRSALAICYDKPDHPVVAAALAGFASDKPHPSVGEVPTRSRLDPIWGGFLSACRRASAGSAIEMLARATGEKNYSDNTSRHHQIRHCWALLDDDRVWRATDKTHRPLAKGLDGFESMRVGDFAAMQLARKLDLPWRPLPSWGEQQWGRYTERVRKAVLRLDEMVYRGVLELREE